jgi:muconate cycloisomerase
VTATVDTVEVLSAQLPFRFSFGHALAARRSSTNVYVKVTLSDGSTGFGEGVPREYVTGESTDTALAVLCDGYAPALLGRAVEDAESVAGLLAATAAGAGGAVPGAAWCAVELAVLDAVGHHLDTTVRRWLGPLRSPVLEYDAVVPFTGRRVLGSLAVAIRLLGIRRVKLKVGRDVDEDVRSLRLLRRLLGGDADIRVDANCAWSVEEAFQAIERMRPYRISLVEQPVAAGDLDGLRRLTAECEEDIAVDESLRTEDEARALIDMRACDAFNIRVSKCGGLLSSMRIATLAADAGLTCIVGAQVGESGILSAASRHLAACVAPRHLEGSAGRLLLKEDLVDERIAPGRRGRARVFDGPGLGVHVCEDRLRNHARSRHVVDSRAAPASAALTGSQR